MTDGAMTERAAEPAFVWTCVLPPPGRSTAAIQRAAWLTPYTAATIAADALHAGRGAELQMTVRGGLSDAELASVRGTFAWLRGRGVRVSVHRQTTMARAAVG